MNKDAPTGGTVKGAAIKPGTLLKAVLKNLGDGGTENDIYQGAYRSQMHECPQAPPP